MRTLEDTNRVRNGLMGIIILLLVVAVGQSFVSVPMIFATPTYYAQFKDAAGIHPGDKVRVAGVDVGDVRSTTIEGDHITVGFALQSMQVGTDSRVSIRTDTILGRKNIEIEPRGTKSLQANGILPLGQTTTPYQIYDAFFDVTKAASKWDIQKVKDSLNVLADTIDQTYPHLTDALKGIQRFSDTIGKRDDQINQLLGNANKIAGVLGNRSEQINSLLVNAQTLLSAVNERGQAITYLLERVSSFSEQVTGFINENPNLNHVLEQLRTISDTLRERKLDLADSLTTLSKFTASLGEAIASGPYFKVMLVNLLPYQILQPFVDAAFKKRGIDPENFWRGAGLPAFRWPDPNGARFPNGAPAPGPAVLEGTPEFPGPAVPAGTPCSYTPPADGIPTAGNPLPCSHLDQSQGPYGPYAGPDGGPNVVTSPPNPNGPGYTPGITSAGVPGQTPPDLQGSPVPLPPAPPGARTEPIQGPSNPFPPYGVPPGDLPGPPPPAGPGPQVPDAPPPGIPLPVDTGGR
ncbi:MAG: phospholipid/cholesterol/gamma-HCH transport system substrate-binding protein [Mycobacterium sp.]|jgi:phospholipid/cholesterol/gamma-HCH transport system substrate-binding protein|nr:phospholipid/cholesterol/gamma-HCH transport system substrate-binding protein [Mycobacterium sp.]